MKFKHSRLKNQILLKLLKLKKVILIIFLNKNENRKNFGFKFSSCGF